MFSMLIRRIGEIRESKDCLAIVLTGRTWPQDLGSCPVYPFRFYVSVVLLCFFPCVGVYRFFNLLLSIINNEYTIYY